MWRATYNTLKRVWQETGDDDVAGLAAALAYHFLLALFPFFIFLTALGGVVVIIVGGDNPSAAVVRELGANLPPQLSELVTRELQDIVQSASPSLVSVGVVGAVWATMAGTKSIMRAMNLAYDVPESRPFLKQNLVALGLSLLFGVFVLGAFALFVLGDIFTLQIASLLGLPTGVVTVTRWIIAIGLLLVATAFVYWAAPNVDLRFRWITPGSILFCAGWLAATAAFAFYVDRFGSYNATYGTLGGVVVLLVWFYLTGYILLLGAELNAVLD